MTIFGGPTNTGDGQQLTHDPNDPTLNARAGFGGDVWGAFGGGFTPVRGNSVLSAESKGIIETLQVYDFINNIPYHAGISNGGLPGNTPIDTANGVIGYHADDNTTNLWSADESNLPPTADNTL